MFSRLMTSGITRQFANIENVNLTNFKCWQIVNIFTQHFWKFQILAFCQLLVPWLLGSLPVCQLITMLVLHLEHLCSKYCKLPNFVMLHICKFWTFGSLPILFTLLLTHFYILTSCPLEEFLIVRLLPVHYDGDFHIWRLSNCNLQT